MPPRGPVDTDILLLGAGHAHVEVLRRFAMRPEPGVRLTLIGREPETPYSGMLPGVIRGDYQPREAHIDLAPSPPRPAPGSSWARPSRSRLEARTVTVPGRPDIPFDLLSINVGGEPGAARTAASPSSRSAASWSSFARWRPRCAITTASWWPAAGRPGSNWRWRSATVSRRRYRIALVSGTPEPLIEAPESARRVAVTALVDAKVEIVARRIGRRVPEQSRGACRTAASWTRRHACGRRGWKRRVSWHCRAWPATLSGCVQVDTTLRSVSDPAVFAAGDCASIIGSPRPKAGVWAVRAGEQLAGNLRLAARHRPLKRWRPQREALVILGLGHGRAVAWRNGLSVSGTLVWRLKDWIDRRWMRMYTEMRMTPDPADPMRCGGCGAKVGAEVLAGALADLKPGANPDLLVGLEAPDDAAVLRVPEGKLLVQSADHFRAFLDDPFVFGQVAAAHAVSDLHAMGARPWTALAIAAVPYGPGEKMRTDLSAMLLGATDVLRRDGCALVGGHSGEADEAALGFAVCGLAEPETLTRKSGLRVGDALIVTKPIGTGIVLAGHMRGLTRAAWLSAAIRSMCATNAQAAGILRAHGVTACTDVTGFGLAGHLAEMARASGVAATIWRDAVPVLPGALELAARGVESTLAPDNARAVPNLSTEPRERVLIDPQTSGGLLGGVPDGRAATCLRALRAAGMTAAIIGVVEAAAPDAPMIRIASKA